MRKVLSFVLVLALVLGSFSMAFATAPADVAGTPNAEAVEVLMGLGVVSGYPDGTYKPENIVTRAEMAKLIVVALGLEDYATGTSKFADMSGATWAQGYVNYAAGLGIIKGYPDGTFKPSATVSYDEASAMIVRALGYTDASLLPATWPSNYVVKAKALGILDGVKSSVLGANRGDIAEMLYNALTLDIGTVDADNKWNANDTSKNGDNPDNFLVRLGAEFNDAAIVYGNEDTMINLVPYTGTYAETYTVDDEIVAVAVLSDSITGDFIPASGIAKGTGAGIINASTADDTDYNVSYSVARNDVVYFWNGVEEPTSDKHPMYSIDTITTATGHSTFAVDLSGKRVDDSYAVSYWQVSGFGLFDESDADDIADDQTLMGYNFILDDNDEIDLNQFVLEGAATLADIDVDDVVYVYDGWHGAGIKKIQVGTEVVTGKVTEKDGSKYTIDGKTYKLAGNEVADKGKITAPDFKVGDTVTARLDFNGNIYSAEVDSSTPDTYAIVKAYAGDTAFDDAKVKLFTSDDTNKTFNVDEDVTATFTTGSVIGYALDKDGVIDAVNTNVKTATTATLSSVSVLKTNNGSYAVDKDVVVFTVDADGAYDITSIAKVETGVNVAPAAGFQMIMDKDGKYVVAMLVDADAAGATDDDTYAVIDKVVTALDADDEAIQKLTGFVAGTAVTKYTDDADDLALFSKTAITLWNLTTDAEGIVTSAVKVTPVVDYKAIVSVNADDTAVKVGTEWYALADNAVVYEADNDGGYTYSASSKAALRDGFTVSLFDTDDENDGYEVVIFER